ncbi:MAG: hypothetical protein ACLRVU_09145 [Beduini sp.]
MKRIPFHFEKASSLTLLFTKETNIIAKKIPVKLPITTLKK